MNRLIYPGWQTHVEIDVDTFSDYDNIFEGLKKHYGISYDVNPVEPLCKSMLWRLKPVFWEDIEIVLCRDADAITTWRETMAVRDWIESGETIHGINDNPAHALPIMGGMCGFMCEPIRKRFEVWDNFVGERDYSVHGSDQHTLNGYRNEFSLLVSDMSRIPILSKADPLWTSDLTCRHIGSAGVVEMETIRFFNVHDANSKFIETEKKYPHVFYWHL